MKFTTPIRTLEMWLYGPTPAPMPTRTLFDCIPWTFVYDLLGPIVGLR